MSDDPITLALGLPSGASFHRCALQVNPHHYNGTFRGDANPGDARAHAKAMVDRAVELGISVLAITDHNDVSDVPLFRHAAEGSGVTIFPGFELSSSEGIHVLCIYPPTTEDEQLSRFLGGFGITRPEPSSDLSNATFVDLLAKVREQGGVAIAAHVTNDKGLFKVLRGQPRVQAWRCNDLSAIQIPAFVEDLSHDVRQIVEDRDDAYRREHAADAKLAIAVVNAKDVITADDLEDRAATCLIKMSEVSVEGLRQAFLDPGSRIRLNNPKAGELDDEEHSELVAITWEGGFLDGAAIHFNPNLNVLVGGRGAGKSSVVESIRAVLALDALGDEAQKTHKEVVRHVIKSATKISLLVRAHRPEPRLYRIERTIPDPPIVWDDQGQISDLTPREILPRVELYGQHEISELTGRREKLTRLLDRFVEPDHDTQRRKAELRRELEKNHRSLLEAQTELDEIEERLSELPGLEETLERFREAGLEARLREQSLLVREERVIASIPERLAPLRSSLEMLRRELPLDRLFLSGKALEELPGREILGRADDVLKRLDPELTRIAGDLEQALQRADEGIAEVRAEWATRKAKVQADYERILRELHKSRIDGEEFIRLRREIEALRPLRERQSQAERLLKELRDRRRSLLAEWEDTKAKEQRGLARAAKKIGRKLKGNVQVEVAAGNREPLFALLRNRVGGRLSTAIDRLDAAQDLSLTAFVAACRSGAGALAKAYSITPKQAERLANAGEDVLMCVEELELLPTIAIRLNTAEAGEPPEWRELDNLSKGQKATAVLLLLLLESDAPLIVDQPEDDLDNRFITEGVVRRMRSEKQHRQFIFSTHNANIVVLGDAELIVGLSAKGEGDGQAQIAPEYMGSIDAGPVRELVEEILEGGKHAFERRRRKYGF